MDDQISDRLDTLTDSRTRRETRAHASIWPRVILLLVIALACLGVAWIVWHPRATPTSGGGRFSGNGPMPVVTATAVRGDVPITLNGLGTVTPLATVTVRTQINGQLVQVAFSEGQTVNKGDFLAQVDPRPYQLALDQLTGQLLKDQALLQNAQTDLKRFRTLKAQDSIAGQQVDTQDSLVHQLEGTVKTDQALVDNAKLNLAYCHIVSPITGKVGLRQVDQGNYVQVSDPNGIVVVTQLKPISVIFTLPEDSLPAISEQLRTGGATLAVVAFDRTRTTKIATGKLVSVDNQIDTTTGTVKLRAEFDNADESLYPNQFVNAQLLVSTLHDAVVVPTASIQRGAPGTFVYLVDADLTVKVQPVTLGPSNGERIAIQKGLEPGDKVVIDGADKLREGAKVTLPADNAAKQPPGPGAAAGQPASAAPGQPIGAGAPAGQPQGADAGQPNGPRGVDAGQAKPDGKKRRSGGP